jgi:restriction endonuclease S subunit
MEEGVVGGDVCVGVGQTKIANFLSVIDDKINVVAKQIEKMEEWKKGLLGEMFE